MLSLPQASSLPFRDYQDHDFDMCCDIFVSNIPRYFFTEELSDYQNYLKSQAKGSYWILKHEQRLIACGGIYLDDQGVGSLCYGLVQAAYHQQKWGSLLLLYRMIKLFSDPSLSKIRLHTCQHTDGFFEKFGFSTTRVLDDHYGPGLHRYDMEFIVPKNKDQIASLRLDHERKIWDTLQIIKNLQK